jgi:hypothetical protein
MRLTSLHKLAICSAVFLAGTLGSAQVLKGSFGPVGVVKGQTARLSVQAIAPNPCNAQITWGDLNGNILSSARISLQPGQSTLLDWKDPGPMQRSEVTPSLVATLDANGNTGCLGTTEVFDNLTGYTRVTISANPVLVNPGPIQTPAGPGSIGVGLFETVRLNVSGLAPNACIGQLSFTDASGNPVGSSMNVNLGPGQSTFLDLNGNTLVRRLGQRMQVQPVVTPTPGTPSSCQTSVELYEQFFGSTVAMGDGSVVPGTTREGDPGPISFGAIGLVAGQTAQLNVVAFPPDPCMVQLEFTDSNGSVLASSSNTTLNPGQSASLKYLANPGPSQRTEITPLVLVSNPTGGNVAGCIATVESFDNVTGFSRVLKDPGPMQFGLKDPGPVNFGMLGVGLLQTARLNAEGISTDPAAPCTLQLSFADGNGNVLSSGPAVTLNQGQISSFDLNGNTLVTGFGERAEIRPLLTQTSAPGTCSASAEVYEQLTGRTLANLNAVSTGAAQ